MESINLADAKAHLSELIDRVEKGESIQILRRGKPVALLVAPNRPRKPFPLDEIRAFTDSLPFQTESSADLIRKMRDDGY